MLKLKEGFILREVAGETVVIPSGEDINLNMMITLNGTGAFLWQKLEQGCTEEELVAALLAEYDVDAAGNAFCTAAGVSPIRNLYLFFFSPHLIRSR